jgi:Fe-S cluster assembly protein SufD
VIATTEILRPWLEEFEVFHRRAGGPEWLRELRAEAFASFSKLGFPTTKDEDWRFTSVRGIANTAFHLAPELPAKLPGEGLPQSPPGIGAALIFVNGQLVPPPGGREPLPAGVVVKGLKEALGGPEGGELERHLGRYEPVDGDAFTALNTAFLRQGAYVRVPRGTVVERPVYLLYVSTPAGVAQMTHPRNLILIEEGAQATVVEDYLTLGEWPAEGISSFTNAVTELVAGENATVAHFLVKREGDGAAHVSTLRIEQQRSANVAAHAVLLGGALVRNNVHPVLAGEGGECLINGFFLGQGSQHLDNYMKVEHRAAHGQSRQFYSGILDGEARGVFHGRIIVHPDAQKTDAKQTNRNLLLSDATQMDTKPQLEIYADDVKCTHGATIGQMDETALFYLRSRGVPEAEARALLLYAFAHENLERMKPAVVRDWLAELITRHLPAAAAQPPGKGAAERSGPEAG